MIFLISVALVLLMILMLRNVIIKYSGKCIAVTVLVSVTALLTELSNISVPMVISTWVSPVFIRGGIAGAMFFVVMVTGAFPNGSRPIKFLAPMRSTLSIMACVLTLGHNMAYGRVYFVKMFTDAASMPAYQLMAAVCSLCMMAVMLPLFVTSFPAIRRKMAARSWKKLQRMAYIFYGLMYCHVMLLNSQRALAGNANARINVIVYTAAFGTYAVCRICKYAAAKFDKRKVTLHIQCCATFIWIIAASVIMFFIFDNSSDRMYAATDSKMEAPAQSTQDSYASYKDGLYSGSAMGMNAKIAVSVRIENGVIADITIESSKDDEPYFTEACAVIDEILNGNSADVDTVSGATYSSGGIIDAVRSALAAAK